MQVHLLTFGVLRDWFGSRSSRELPENATVSALLHVLSQEKAAQIPPATWSSIAVSVNAEYAQSSHVLREGDEVGLLPPVSGGAPFLAQITEPEDRGLVALTLEVIDTSALLAAAKRGEDGAVVLFDGIVRNNTRGRRTLYLDYEAYQEMALKQMNELAAQARERFGVRHVTIVHRLGRLQVGESSVLIVVASAHRGHAYEASRWLIDTLKKTVPIWKKETFVDGVVWADGEPFPAEIAVKGAQAPNES